MDFFDVAIAKKLGGSGSGGGSDLPKVTSEDNNKVLTVVEGQWDKANKDWVITETPTTIYDNEVVVEGEAGQPYYQVTLEIDSLLKSETAHITFNGIEYDCECTELAAYGMIYYMYGGTLNIETGEVDFSTYPFTFICSEIQPATVMGLLFVPQLGTYSLEIEGVIETITVSDDFEIVINNLIDSLVPKIIPTPSDSDNNKLLVAYGGKYELQNQSNLIPSIPWPSYSNRDKILGLDEQGQRYILKTGIPTPTPSYSGLYLKVNNSGDGYTFGSITSIPTPSSYDNDKILGVKNNAYSLISLSPAPVNIKDSENGAITTIGPDGYGNASGQYSKAFGGTASGYSAVSFGGTASGTHAVSFGGTASGNYAATFGSNTQATQSNSVAFGRNTLATGTGSHAEGGYETKGTTVRNTTAQGIYSHAEGIGTYANGEGAHSEGIFTTAGGNYSHAEGRDTEATGLISHAEGYVTQAEGSYSHAEGDRAEAVGRASHAEGCRTIASGIHSHAQNEYTIANARNQTALGIYNIADIPDQQGNGTYAVIIGNGSSDSARSNAATLDWSGNQWLAGSITLGNTTLTESDLQALLALLT